MKTFFLATVAAVTISAIGTACAADLAARPYTKAPAMVAAAAYDWSGFYIGANGGYAWANDSRDNNAGRNLGSYDAKGGTAGGQIGYRWQTGAWVWGLEAQGNWADLNGSTVNAINGLNLVSSDVDAFGLFTGQLGYAWNNVLFYAKGGAAVVDQRFTFRGLTGTLGAADTGYSTRWGASAGGGIEVGFAPNWTFGVAYDHIFLDRRDIVVPTATANPYRSGGDLDIATVRVNYKFGGPVVARY